MMNGRYGDPHKVLVAYRKEIKDWPVVKAGDANGFRRFFKFLIKCRSLISNRQASRLINNPDVICMLLAKLPTYMQDRWNRNVYTIRHPERREGKLSDLTDLADKETVLVNDPFFLRDAVSQFTGKPDKYDRTDRRQKLKTYTNETREGSEPVKCPACDKNHDLEGCQAYLNKSLEDRSKFIYKSKLCYGCLSSISKDHNAKKCKNRRSCKKCQEKH